jgi:hypothetical protein
MNYYKRNQLKRVDDSPDKNNVSKIVLVGTRIFKKGDCIAMIMSTRGRNLKMQSG